MANRVISNQWPYMTSASDSLAVIGSPARMDRLLEATPDEITVQQKCGIRRLQHQKKAERLTGQAEIRTPAVCVDGISKKAVMPAKGA